jgi:Fe-S oxidoreductase
MVDILKEQGGKILESCYQCGTCTATCPWNQVTSFMLRRLIHKAQLGLVDFEDEEVWRCVACRLCVDRCPRGVEVPDVMRSLRRVVMEVGAGAVQQGLRIADKNISAVGNPLGEPREKRTDWARDLGLKAMAKDTEILYFPCCYQAYDARCRAVSRATVKILQKAKVDFGILGPEQSCCGESIRKAGHESVFQSVALGNIDLFKQAGGKKILVTSPHCCNTFKEEYPDMGGKFEVVHFVQYLSTLIEEGRLKPSKEIKRRVAYHDSCLLGRYSGMYDEPRQILQKLPGVELVEMWNAREYSLCCGGGAGRLWQETKKGERFSDLRVDQAAEVEAGVLAASCPYCLINFEDSVLATVKGDSLKVMDVNELVEEAIQA